MRLLTNRTVGICVPGLSGSRGARSPTRRFPSPAESLSSAVWQLSAQPSVTEESGENLTNVNRGRGAGTSAGAPSFAGMIALLKSMSAGGRPAGWTSEHHPNVYGLFQSAPSAFHDIAIGDNIAHCTGTEDCLNGLLGLGYSAGRGYAMGLGSVDAFNLITSWSIGVDGSVTVLNRLTSTASGTTNGSRTFPASVTTLR